MSPDVEPKPCKPISTKNVEDILQGISGFLQCWDGLGVVDVGGPFSPRQGTWIGYWTYVRLVLTSIHRDSPLTLMHGFGPQSHVDVLASKVVLLGNGEVREQFDKDDHYVEPASNCPPLYGRVAMD